MYTKFAGIIHGKTSSGGQKLPGPEMAGKSTLTEK